MNYWKRVLSNCFDVLNPNIKLCLLLVELEISFWCVRAYELLEWSVF